MSAYVGVDLSTRFVDLVKLDEESDRAEWVRVPLVGENAIDRARSYRDQMRDAFISQYGLMSAPGWHWWDDVILCALEDPAGRGDTRKIARVQGVVIASIPARVHVWTMAPSEWRKACGLPGNCSKLEVAEWAGRKRLEAEWATSRTIPPSWNSDACDAYCIAYAARAINQTQEEAA